MDTQALIEIEENEWFSNSSANLIVNEFEMLDSVIPKKFIISNNKLANTLTKNGVELDMEFNLIINRKKEVITKVSLSYDVKNEKFTAYDRVVFNAICSLFEAGNTTFTASQVYRCLNGLDNTQAVSPQIKNAITKSLDKLRNINVKIDYQLEAEKLYKTNESNKCIVEDRVLPLKKVTLLSGREKVIGYKLYGKPIIYEYAQFTKQVLSVPSGLLNTQDVIARTTPDVIVIREYLIRRIEAMKNPKNKLSNNILLVSIFEEAGQSTPTKQKAAKLREIIEQILSKYKVEKYIKDFVFYKEGRVFKGVEIIY